MENPTESISVAIHERALPNPTVLSVDELSLAMGNALLIDFTCVIAHDEVDPALSVLHYSIENRLRNVKDA